MIRMLLVDQVSVVRGGTPRSFEVAAGHCLGLLGPSPDHTSRWMLTSAGLMRPLTGSVRIGDSETTRDREVARRRMAITRPQSVDTRLRMQEYLHTVAQARRASGTLARAPVAAVIDRLGLDGACRLTSPAARAEASLAAALLPAVGLVILDEPFAQIRPETRRLAIEWIRALATDAVAVLIGGREERDLRAVSHTVISTEPAR
jgi:ABC-type multidrug transport system ATPase subunit